jgi:hypothetical protein
MPTLRELAINIRTVVGSAFTGPLNKAKSEIKSFGTEVTQTFEHIEERSERVANVFKGITEAFVGIEVIDQLKKIAEAANNAADAMEIAGRVTKNFGHEFDAEGMDRWLRRLAASAQGGGFALTSMRESVQALATTGASETQQQRLLVDVLGLAAAKHMNVQEATHLAVEAATGHVEMLGRYGIAVKDATGKTVDFATAMSRWESMVAGAAEKRAEGLEGAFGRVTNALDRLVNTRFGQQLVTDFEGAANAIAHVLDAVAKLPPWFLAAAAAISFSTLSLTALGLMLPAVKLALEFLGNGLALVGSAFGLAAKAVSPLISVLSVLGGRVITVVVAGFRDLVTWVSLARDAFVTATVAEWLAEAPLLAIIAAIAAVIAVVVELILHLNELGEAFENVINFASRAWKELADGFQDNAKSIGYAIKAAMEFKSGDWIHAAQDLKSGQDLSRGMPQTEKAIFTGFKAGTDRAMEYVKNAWTTMTKVFTAQLGEIGKQGASWAGLGGPGKVDQKGINDWLTAMLAAIDKMLAIAQQHVEAAKARLAETTANLETLRDKRDPFKSLTVDGPTGIAAEQAIEREQLERTLALRRAVAEQRAAELRAAQAEASLMRSLPASDQERAKHLAEIGKRMNEHVLSAIKMNAEFAKLGGTIAKLGREIAHAFDPLTLQTLDLEKLSKTRSEHGGEYAVSQQKELDKRRFDLQSAIRTPTPVDSEQEAHRQAEFDRALARLQKGLAQEDYYNALARAKTMAPVAGLQLVEQATQALYQATLKVTAADDAVAASSARLREALENTGFNLTKFTEGLIAKLNIPGLSVRERSTPDGRSAGIEFGKFNWTTLLLDAAQKSKAFGDVMNVVNQVMQVFAEIIDALRPVIDLVLKAVAAVANIFISLYNVIARILRAFGIHVALLDKINTDFTNLHDATAPLISIVHDIPTLNELASGNIGKLSPTPINYSNLSQIQQPTIDALKSPDVGGGLLGVLRDILEGVLGLKLLGLFGGGGGILGAITGAFKGGIGGIVSGIGKLFGFGAKGGPDMGAASFGSWDDPAAVAQGGGVGGGGLLSFLKTSGLGALLAGVGIGDLGVTLGQQVGGGIPGGILGALGAAGGLSVALGGGLSLTGLGAALSATGFGLPVGAIVAGVGALLGSGVFGDHNSKQNEPDKFLPGYQQFLSAYNNGSPSDLGFQLEALLKTVNPANLAGQALADFKTLIGLGGSNGDIGIANEKNDKFTFGSGMTAKVEDFIDLVKRAFTELGGAAQDALGGALQALALQAQSVTRSINAGMNELGGQLTAIQSGASAANLISGATKAVSPIPGGGDVHISVQVTTGDINSGADHQKLKADIIEAIIEGQDIATRNRQYLLG